MPSRRRPRLFQALRELMQGPPPVKPFDCAWCSGRGSAPSPQHDMCTGVSVRPHGEIGPPAAVVACACAERGHRRSLSWPRAGT